VFNNTFPNIWTVYEIMWENIVERSRAQMAIWRMRVACWITKATNTHSEYVRHCFFQVKSGYARAPQWYKVLINP